MARSTLARLQNRDAPGARADALAALALVALIGAYAAAAVDFSVAPFEDAAILMRYAQHLAAGLGIVWNADGGPVDGATDFLFLVSLAGLARAGLSIELATRLLGALAHVATVLAAYLALRRVGRAGALAAFVPAAYLAVGPGLRYVAAYFGTPVFALFALLSWIAVLLLEREPARRRWAVAFAAASLIMGLIRPEGVILSALMLLGLVCLRGPRAALPALRWYVALHAVLGGAYFAWRWSYFGYPLPNPFYVKGGGALYWDSLRESLRGTSRMGLPFLPAFVAALRTPALARRALGYAVPVAGFACAFVLLSNAMNLGWRFQYATLPILAVSWYALVRDLPAELALERLAQGDRHWRRALVALGLVASLGVVAYSHSFSRHIRYYRDGRYDVARALLAYRGEGYTLATTEAGLLPFYSEWRTVDTAGLNDPWIAHHGGVTEEYLDRFRPELIVFHEYFSPLTGVLPRDDQRFRMTRVLLSYVERHGYVLAASFGDSPRDTHYYYVRPGFAHEDAVLRDIRATDYTWHENGHRALDFAAACRPDGRGSRD